MRYLILSLIVLLGLSSPAISGTRDPKTSDSKHLAYGELHQCVVPVRGRLEMEGMKEGETKSITIESKDAYGPIKEDHYQEVEKQYVPDTVKEGEMLQANGPQGPMTVKVKEVNEKTVILDANHPLAGKDLIFDLEVVSVS